jgi:hypothetical protein
VFEMIDIKILKRAMLVGMVFEFLLVVAGHFSPMLRDHFMLFGCMMIAGVAGLLYARDLARGFRLGALGGGVTGSAAGIVAVGASNVLGDRPDLYIPYGVMVLTLIGAIGGLFGQLDAVLRKLTRPMKD